VDGVEFLEVHHDRRTKTMIAIVLLAALLLVSGCASTSASRDEAAAYGSLRDLYSNGHWPSGQPSRDGDVCGVCPAGTTLGDRVPLDRTESVAGRWVGWAENAHGERFKIAWVIDVQPYASSQGGDWIVLAATAPSEQPDSYSTRHFFLANVVGGVAITLHRGSAGRVLKIHGVPRDGVEVWGELLEMKQ